MPANIQQTVRRRGAISAEPINEEDAATYVKKVSHHQPINDENVAGYVKTGCHQT